MSSSARPFLGFTLRATTCFMALGVTRWVSGVTAGRGGHRAVHLERGFFDPWLRFGEEDGVAVRRCRAFRASSGPSVGRGLLKRWPTVLRLLGSGSARRSSETLVEDSFLSGHVRSRPAGVSGRRTERDVDQLFVSSPRRGGAPRGGPAAAELLPRKKKGAGPARSPGRPTRGGHQTILDFDPDPMYTDTSR
jgi:hypothetical protein